MKGCLTVIAVIIALIAAGIVLVWVNRDTITTGITQALEQPEYGKKEYIDQHYGDTLRTIDAAAANTTSLFSFGSAIESLSLPADVLYVGIHLGQNTTDIIKRFDWNGRTTFTVHNYGSGTLSSGDIKKKIMIYENEGSWNYMDKFVVYIEYKGSVEAVPPQ